MRRFLVIGLGRFGRATAEELAAGGGEVIGVDANMALVEGARDILTVAAQIDNVDVDALREAGAAEVDAAVVAMGEDFAAEVLSVAVLRELGVPRIVARASTDRERRILELVGATRVIAVEVEMGHRVARSLLSEGVVDQIDLGGGASIVYWTADDRVIDKSVAACEMGTRHQVSLVAVRRPGQDDLDMLPGPEYVFQPGDVLVLAGTNGRLTAFTR